MSRFDPASRLRFGQRSPADRAFGALWIGQTISGFGSQLSLVALPAGLLADRLDRRRMMIACDLGRAAAMAAAAIAFLTGWLSMGVLYVIAVTVGVLSVGFTVAYQSYVPELLPRHRLIEGNQRLELSEAAARVGGPSIAGVLIGTVGGMVAVAFDALSYVASALALRVSARTIPARSVPGTAHPVTPADAGMLAGVTFVGRDRVLRDLAASTAIFNFGSGMALAILALFATREVGISPAAYGLMLGAGNVGFILGAMTIGRAARRLGSGPLLLGGAIFGIGAIGAIAIASGPYGIVLLFAGRFLGALAAPLYNVTLISIRQARTPGRRPGSRQRRVPSHRLGPAPDRGIHGRPHR